MKYTCKGALSSAPKLLTASMLSIILVACGGGTSGDGTVDSGNLDGFGSTDDSGDFDELDLGLDGGDTSDEEDNFVAVSDLIIEDAICKGQGGVGGEGIDEDSSNENWNDNCQMRGWLADGAESPFKISTYSEGIQRVLYCSGAAGAVASTVSFATGDFHLSTFEAVKEFQTAEGLVSDGVVGPGTWAALQSKVLADDADAFLGTDTVNGFEVEVYGVLQSAASVDQGIDCTTQRNFLGLIAEDFTIGGWRLTDGPGGFGMRSFSIEPI